MDPSVAPSPRRLAVAWQAGLRARPRWLARGAVALAVAAAVDIGGSGVARMWGRMWIGAVERQVPFDVAAASAALTAWGMILLGALAVVGIVHVISGSAGPVRDGAARRLGQVAVRAPMVVTAILATILGLGVLWAVAPVVGGAARAVDASPDGLAKLWQIWLVRGLSLTGAAMIVVGIVEVLAWRRSIVLALFQTVEQAREERIRG